MPSVSEPVPTDQAVALVSSQNPTRTSISPSALHFPLFPLLFPRRHLRPGLTLLRPHWVQHNLIRRLRCIGRVALTPIITNRVREDVAIPVEARRADGPADLRIALQAVLGVLVPEVEGAVAAGRAKGAMHGMKGDRVDGIDVRYVSVAAGGGLSVAFKGEVGAEGGKGVSGGF